MKILDSQETEIVQENNYILDGTATFTYKIPSNITAGEYLIQVWNVNSLQTTSRLIRIRDYFRDLISIKTDLQFESYRPGDTVTGTIKAELMEGKLFEGKVLFTF